MMKERITERQREFLIRASSSFGTRVFNTADDRTAESLIKRELVAVAPSNGDLYYIPTHATDRVRALLEVGHRAE